MLLQVKQLTIISQETNQPLLQGVDFEVAEQEIHCILGKNGSGKSTLAYGLMGLQRYQQSGGQIVFEGKDISKLKTNERARLGIALAFQEPARFEGLSVRDFLQISRPGGKATDEEMIKVLELVGLKDGNFLKRQLDEKLSGGERKRIELASVIMMKPKLMILDEPDASLDIIVYNELYDLMLKIRQEIGCSILLITHREEAGLIADKATLIDQHQAVLSGRFRQVMSEYCKRTGARERCQLTRNPKVEIL